MVKHIEYWRKKGHTIPPYIEEAYKMIEEWERTQAYIDK